MVRWLKTSILAGMMAASQTVWGRPALDAHRLEQLARYEVVLLSDAAGAGMLRHRAVGIFDFSPDEVYRIATSYEHYSEYMPRVVASHVVSQGPEQTLVSLEASLPWPLNNVWVFARFQSDLFLDETDHQAYRVRFGMVRGNLLRYEGVLLIEPYGEGRTTVTYELLAEPDSHLPRGWVQRAVGRGASNFVHHLRARVIECHGAVRR